MSLIQSNQIVLLPAAASTLAAADSGKIFMVDQSAACIHTLPTPAAGLCYKFILKTVGANVVQIKEAGAGTHVIGHTISGPVAAPVVTVGTGTNTVRFSTTCVAGDTINLASDGISWYVQATSGSNVANTSIIFV